jgi:hypothetical protein
MEGQSMLPPRSVKLVESTPIHRLEKGYKACVELTVYPDAHAGIAVSRIEGKPPNRRIVQQDTLPLNDVEELRSHTLAILDHLATEAGAPASTQSARGESAWRLSDLHRELRRFEKALVEARLAPASISTYVDRTERFLRWLGGDYAPRGPR